MARGRWLKRMGKKIANRMDDLRDDADEFLDDAKDSAGRLRVVEAIQTISRTSKSCYTISQETVEICDKTASARDEVIDFADTIQKTLSKVHRSDASILETIKDLTAGDKVEAATNLARTLRETAVQCTEKSLNMIDLLEEGLDALPDRIQNAVLRKADNLDDSGEEDGQLQVLRGIDDDVDNVKKSIDAVRNLNLSTAMSVGLEAFTALAHKAMRSKELFDTIRNFAVTVNEITDAVKDLDVVTVVQKSKQVLRCIKLTDTVRLLAEAAAKLVAVMIELFQEAASKISAVWAALAFAKDCLLDCIKHVTAARDLCRSSLQQSADLVERGISIRDQFEQVDGLNLEAIKAIKKLVKSGEIQQAIDLATSMDDLLLKCANKVVMMVKRVTEAFQNMPKILMDGIDVEAQGHQDDDPDPANVEDDIRELADSRRELDQADFFRAAKAAVRGFSGVSNKGEVCKNMLSNVDDFAGGCDTTINAFMKVWDLRSAETKISEMCRVVKLGEMIKQFANQIKRLLLAIINFMKGVVEKFSKIDDVAEHIVGTVGSAVDDAFDAVKDKFKNKFWKKRDDDDDDEK